MPRKLVDEVAHAIEQMGHEEREALLLRMGEMGGLIEDLEDIAALLRSSREPARPYQEFLEELESESREVQS